MKIAERLQRANLTSHQIQLLENMAVGLSYAADLMGIDIFLDCQDAQTKEMFVAYQFSPMTECSAYRENIVGSTAEQKNEPAVYHVMRHGVSLRDFRAITQENCVVRQDVMPIMDEEQRIFAVCISERDVSQDVQNEKKYQELARKQNTGEQPFFMPNTAVREIHHRVKNNLQMIASIMNLQARQSDHPEVQQLFRENIARISSISSVYDLFVHTDLGMVSLFDIFEKLSENLQKFIPLGKNIVFRVFGTSLLVSQHCAADLAFVVNELLTNAIKHAFADREEGEISITLKSGVDIANISIQDNGVGFCETADTKNHFGLAIVEAVVKEKLGGELHISSTEKGTVITFDFLIDHFS